MATLVPMDARTMAGNVLTLPRFVQTVRAARQFDRARPTPRSTDGESRYRMRSVMDLDPRIGKAISKLAIRDPGVLAWQTADPSTSRFVDSSEIDSAVTSLQRDGFYGEAEGYDRDAARTPDPRKKAPHLILPASSGGHALLQHEDQVAHGHSIVGPPRKALKRRDDGRAENAAGAQSAAPGS